MKESISSVEKFASNNPGTTFGVVAIAGLVIYGLFKNKDFISATKDGVTASNKKIEQDIHGIKNIQNNGIVNIEQQSGQGNSGVKQTISDVEYGESITIVQNMDKIPSSPHPG